MVCLKWLAYTNCLNSCSFLPTKFSHQTFRAEAPLSARCDLCRTCIINAEAIWQNRDPMPISAVRNLSAFSRDSHQKPEKDLWSIHFPFPLLMYRMKTIYDSQRKFIHIAWKHTILHHLHWVHFLIKTRMYFRFSIALISNKSGLLLASPSSDARTDSGLANGTPGEDGGTRTTSARKNGFHIFSPFHTSIHLWIQYTLNDTNSFYSASEAAWDHLC